MTRVYKKLTAIQERLAAPLPEEVYEEEESVRSSNVTQDLPSSNGTQEVEVEPGSLRDHDMDDAAHDLPLEPGSAVDHDMRQGPPLDPDMAAYKHDPFERHVQVDSLKNNQRILEELRKIISDSAEHTEERQFYSTERFAETSNKISVWRKELWMMTLRDPEGGDDNSRWEVALHRITQLISLLFGVSPEEVNQILSGDLWDMIDTYESMIIDLLLKHTAV